METHPTNSNGAVNGDNITNLTPAINGGGKKAEFSILWIEDVEFITDGHFQCPVKRGSYSLKPFANPSGEEKVQLDGYRLSLVPASDGQPQPPARLRKNYDTLKEANAARKQFILEDANSTSISSQQETTLSEAEVRDAEDASVIMAGLPVPEWDSSAWTYLAMAKFIEKHYKPCRNPKLLSEAVTAFIKLEDEANLKFATVDGKDSHLKRLIKSCQTGIHVHEVPLEMLKAQVHSGKKRKTWKKNKSNLNTFFAWAAHEDQGYIASNPVARIQLKKQKDDYVVPKILTNKQVLDLLTKAQTFKQGRLFLFCVVAIVVALRPAELARITALQKVLGIGSFHFGNEPDEKLVSVIGKTRQLRDSIIPKEFVPLIQAYVQAGYAVIPRNFAHDWTLLRAQVGFLGRMDLLPAHLFSEDPNPGPRTCCATWA